MSTALDPYLLPKRKSWPHIQTTFSPDLPWKGSLGRMGPQDGSPGIGRYPTCGTEQSGREGPGGNWSARLRPMGQGTGTALVGTLGGTEGGWGEGWREQGEPHALWEVSSAGARTRGPSREELGTASLAGDTAKFRRVIGFTKG